MVGLLALPGSVVAPEDGAVYQQVSIPFRFLEPVQVYAYGFMQQVPAFG